MRTPDGIAINAPQVMDGLALLRRLPDECAALVILDPQYRQVLDKLKFGNEGERQNGRAELPQMIDADVRRFVEESERVLRRSGHLALWVDKFALVSGKWRRFMPSDITALAPVDMISWDKMRFGQGRRARCQTEFLIILQKGPLRATGVWTDHGIPDCWSEKVSRIGHPHAKPPGLTERIIMACTRVGDVVVDPCAGSYSVLLACRETRRDFVGCDLVEYKPEGKP